MSLYFDYQSTTPIDQKAYQYMLESLHQNQANPHSNEHLSGILCHQMMQKDMQLIADFLNCDVDEIIITSGATEANNLAFQSILNHYQGKRKRILTMSIEHKSVLEPINNLANKHFKIEYISVNKQGEIDINALKKMMDHDVILISCMFVNNEIGNRYPIKQIADIAHEYGALIHTDASQAIYESIDLFDLDIDMLSLSSHKIYGPKGVGALYVQRDLQESLVPMMYGGGQQKGIRPGTMAPFLVAGFAKAVEVMKQNRYKESEYLKELRKFLLSSLDQYNIYYQINGSMAERHPGNLNLSFDFKIKDFMIKNQKDLCISTGSACNGFSESYSHVLKNLGLSDQRLQGSVRISLGRYTTKEEVTCLIEKIKNYRLNFHY